MFAKISRHISRTIPRNGVRSVTGRTYISTPQISEKPIKVLVTGATGNISYSLIPMICSGKVFGNEQEIDLVLLDLPSTKDKMKGVCMEIDDSCYSILNSLKPCHDTIEAFKDIQYAFLIGSVPRGKGMERSDLLSQNASIFVEQGKAMNNYSDRNIKVVVVGNPCNTNALVCMKNAPNISPENITSLSRLDLNRAKSHILSMLKKMSNTIEINDLHNVVIWGNHSATQYPDVSNCTFCDMPLFKFLKDENYFKNDFIKFIQQRGSEVIKARGSSSAQSAARASAQHMKNWVFGSNFKTVSMGILSDGNPYGIEPGIIYSFPVICRGGSYQIVENLKVSDFSRNLMIASQNELLEERKSAFTKIGSL